MSGFLKLLGVKNAVLRWVFDTATRGIEVLNVGGLLVWLFVLLYNPSVLTLRSYAAFRNLYLTDDTLFVVVFIMAAAVVFAVAGWLWRGGGCGKEQRLARLGLFLGGCMWAVFGCGFAAGYPPLSTGIFYFVPAALCLFSGMHLGEVLHNSEMKARETHGAIV